MRSLLYAPHPQRYSFASHQKTSENQLLSVSVCIHRSAPHFVAFIATRAFIYCSVAHSMEVREHKGLLHKANLWQHVKTGQHVQFFFSLLNNIHYRQKQILKKYMKTAYKHRALQLFRMTRNAKGKKKKNKQFCQTKSFISCVVLNSFTAPYL